jgi:hypothetical protein
MPNNFKLHSLVAIERHLGDTLTELFGEKTFVSIEQMEVTGSERKGVKFVAFAGPERRAKLEAVPLDKT